jgi:hypothetical protein
MQHKRAMNQILDCDDGGDILEFIGCKIDYDRTNKSLRFTQPVLLQSFTDEFKIAEKEMPKTPGTPFKTLQLRKELPVDSKRNTYYRSGVGKLIHLKRRSRPENFAMRDLSTYNTNCTEEHIEAMHWAIIFATTTPKLGLTLAPLGDWDRDPPFEFNIRGYADASYKPYHDTLMNIGGHAVFYKMLLLRRNRKCNKLLHCQSPRRS